MTQSDAVNKMAMEMSHALGDFSHLRTCKFYLNMAITIGTEHFTHDMEEIVAMNCDGIEVGRFKGLRDAARQLGLHECSISKVINGQHHTTGGLMFIKTSDKELIKR